MQIKTKTVSSHTAVSILVKQEVNGTVIHSLLARVRTPSSPVRERDKERKRERERDVEYDYFYF